MNHPIELSALKALIEEGWEKRASLSAQDENLRTGIVHLMNELDRGALRVAEKTGGKWVTHEWIKKGILLSFRLYESVRISGGPSGAHWFDKIPSKFQHWTEEQFREAGFRAVPSATVRHSAFIAKNAVLMPSF